MSSPGKDPGASSTPEPASDFRSSRRLKTLGRFLLFALGVGAVATMVHEVGADKISNAILGTAIWLPLICLLDFSWVALEGGAVLSIYGEERSNLSIRDWVYVTLVHYTTFMLLPMGRATAEVTRAALVRKHIDRDRAVVAAALMQSLTMVGNGLTSLASAVALVSVARVHPLLVALLANAAVMLVLGVSAYLVLRHVKVGGFLGRRFERLAKAGPGFDRQFLLTRKDHLKALMFCLLGRCLQTLQYGVIVRAVTGQLSIPKAWIAEGIQMAARSAGDFIPNQVGVTEGAFVYFRDALGLAALPALAMTVALVARISNVAVASVCAIFAQVLHPRTHPLRA